MKHIFLLIFVAIGLVSCEDEFNKHLQLQLQFTDHFNQPIALIAIDKDAQTIVDTSIIAENGRVRLSGVYNGAQLYQITTDSLAYIVFLEQAQTVIKFDSLNRIKEVKNAPSTIQMLSFHKMYKKHLSQALPLQKTLDSVMYISHTDSIKKATLSTLATISEAAIDSIKHYVSETKYVQLKLYYNEFLKHINIDTFNLLYDQLASKYADDPYFVSKVITEDSVAYGNVNAHHIEMADQSKLTFDQQKETIFVLYTWAAWDEQSVQWAKQLQSLAMLNTPTKPIKTIGLSLDDDKAAAAGIFNTQSLPGGLAFAHKQWDDELLKKLKIKKLSQIVVINHLKEVLYIGNDINKAKTFIEQTKVPITLIDSTTNV